MRISHSGGCKAAAGEGEHHLYESEDLNHGPYGGGDLEELVFNVGLFCSYWTMTDPLFCAPPLYNPPEDVLCHSSQVHAWQKYTFTFYTPKDAKSHLMTLFMISSISICCILSRCLNA